MIPLNNKIEPVLLKGHEKILIYQRELFQESAAIGEQCSDDNIMNVVLVLISAGNLEVRLF